MSFVCEISGFETDSSRSYAKWFCKMVFLVVFDFPLTSQPSPGELTDTRMRIGTAFATTRHSTGPGT